MKSTPALRIAIVGAGLIGRAWSIVFARAGHSVALHDSDAAAIPRALTAIDAALVELAEAQLLDEPPVAVRMRIVAGASLAETLRDVDYVQENIAENLAAKQALYADLDRLAPSSAVLASSTSTIPASAWSRDLPGRARCLVAHPVNPPHLVPVVEISPAPWTAPETVARAVQVQEAAGQVPVVLHKEVQGFVLNRLQGALLREAFQLYAEGVMSADDIDKTIRDGLGLRWALMGPFETIDLNAPGGIADYCARYGAAYKQMGQASRAVEWDAALIQRLEAERRQRLPATALASRMVWRDHRLMQLVAHKRDAGQTDRDS
jgi:3-hydroxyacyl-CoA dehydrogenase